jgi:hypothetical protein
MVNGKTFLSIKEMQIKIILKFHLTPVRLSRKQTTNVGKDVRKKEHLYPATGNVT